MTKKSSALDYTLVLGVDKKHLEQLKMTWPTWIKHKPSLLDHPMVIFYDQEQVNSLEVSQVVPEHEDVLLVPWPMTKEISSKYYEGYKKGDKWTDPQRYKMLTGFVHVPAHTVKTKYWLKIDVDTVATENNLWIDSDWFKGNSAIISHPWGFTKPANQMLELDQWVQETEGAIWVYNHPPLNLKPNEGSSRVRHKRIISWCGFFHTGFTKLCADPATRLCGDGLLPVRSQDGYMWYMAKRGGLPIRRENMKKLGWKHCSTMKTIKHQSELSLET